MITHLEIRTYLQQLNVELKDTAGAFSPVQSLC